MNKESITKRMNDLSADFADIFGVSDEYALQLLNESNLGNVVYQHLAPINENALRIALGKIHEVISERMNTENYNSFIRKLQKSIKGVAWDYGFIDRYDRIKISKYIENDIFKFDEKTLKKSELHQIMTSIAEFVDGDTDFDELNSYIREIHK